MADAGDEAAPSEPAAGPAAARATRAELAARWALWAAIALPAIYQLALLATAIAGRVGYPYDLEWMEGGLLHHALRVQRGQPLYAAPSIDFIPYLYTPLYPTLLAMLAQLGGPLGLSYALGRAVSVLALVGLALTAALQLGRAGAGDGDGDGAEDGDKRAPHLIAPLLAMGLFAAAYPIVEGWYDLVRADTLLLLMVTAPLALLPRWARVEGRRGQALVALAGVLLALAFFCKQTGVFYVAFGGAVVLVVAWRKVPAFVASAGLVGLGGVWLMNRASDGWFWIYVSKIHRAHDFSMQRFWWSFRNILWQPQLPGMPRYPMLGAGVTIAVLLGLAVVAAHAWRRRAVPRAAQPLLLWAAAYAVSTVLGAVGWGTEFAHFNAYMPAFLHGALAAAAAVPAVYACACEALADARDRRRAARLAHAAALLPAALLALTCWSARWSPRPYLPAAFDVAAGAKLIARLRAIDGEVWMPSHPWYLQLAGKTPRVHRMGIKDVTTRRSQVIDGLDEALAQRRFSALVLDQRDLDLELPQLRAAYQPTLELPPDERPRVFTGAKVVPKAIWSPLPKAPGAPVSPAGGSPR